MVGGSAWFIASYSLQALETSVNQVAEELLVDTANLLAQLVENDVQDGRIHTETLSEFVPVYLQRHFNATIYTHQKTHPDLHVYVTNHRGVVIYDSANRYLGADFSNWRDVHATLAGRYGARSSPLDNRLTEEGKQKLEKGLFIAAPIRDGKRIIGALTVVKTHRQIDKYVLLSNRELIIYALFVLLTSLVAGAFITWWLWRSIRKLSRYAKQLGSGEHTQQPKIIHNEFKPLADAMENMYEELAGKEYVENYLHTLAHELKSPLTGVIASTELLQHDLPEAARQNFTQNIHDSATRMTALIDRLLNLASLEKRHALQGVTDIDLSQLLNTLLSERQPQLMRKNLRVDTQLDNPFPLRGEPTLLAQSLANLLDNAMDFSPADGVIRICATYQPQADRPFAITIRDSGAGIAPFAKARLFERFYSTPRPDTQQRSSGLGLAFVKEAIALHGGDISLDTHPDGGAIACVVLPRVD